MAVKTVSPKAELAVLRGMCHRKKQISGALISSVDDTYFYSDESLELYSAIRRHMRDEGEAPSYRLLLEDPEISNEAREHMRDAQPTIQTSVDAARAVKTLNKYRQARGLYNLAANIDAKLNNSSRLDIDSLLDETAQGLSTVRMKRSTQDAFVHFGKNNNSNALVKSILYEDNSDETIPTGIKAFDDGAGGFARGALVTIGANSGGGKSTVASALAVNMAAMGYKVLIVPLEMSKREMTARIMANVTNTDLTKILQQRLAEGERELVYKRYRNWVKKVKAKGGRYTIFRPDEDMDIEEVVAAISAYECDVVIIDYISLLKGVDGDDQWLRLGSVARYAKINAEIENRVNILLCQVDDAGKIRYARAISEHSANSWIWIATDETKETGVTRVEQPKSRNSKKFPFYIKIVYNTMRVEEAPQDDSLGADPDEQQTSGRKSKKKRRVVDDDLPDLSEGPDV
jgi:hypothetical protein